MRKTSAAQVEMKMKFTTSESLLFLSQGQGDVKYHLGMNHLQDFDGRKMHVSLTANPSHLEAVNPVVLGRVRALQRMTNDTQRKKVLGVLIHGDGAFAGQGGGRCCFLCNSDKR